MTALILTSLVHCIDTNNDVYNNFVFVYFYNCLTVVIGPVYVLHMHAPS